jgi:hypothetical protein
MGEARVCERENDLLTRLVGHELDNLQRERKYPSFHGRDTIRMFG